MRAEQAIAGAAIALVVAASTVATAYAAPTGYDAGGGTRVADQGTSRVIASGAGSPAIEAMIVTRRASAAEAEADRATRCSGGRVACSLVDRLTLTVAGKPVDVPPRALLPLADVNEARLVRLAAGRYELVLAGGDAAPAYQARLFFDGRRVTRMDLWSDEAGMVEQRTTFRDLSRAFR